jgi:hypothetical protein
MTVRWTSYTSSSASRECHDLVSAELLELRVQALANVGRHGTQLGPAVPFHAGAHGRDDDLVAVQAERDFTARRHAGGLANAFGDGDLSLFGHVHG